MCREVRKLSDLWREWTAVLRGQLVIATLDSRWGSQWRAGRQSERGCLLTGFLQAEVTSSILKVLVASLDQIEDIPYPMAQINLEFPVHTLGGGGYM
jgi:hypothetical protein